MDCADAPPRHRIDRPNARTATLPALPPLWPMTTGQGLGPVRKAIEASAMSTIVFRPAASCAALLLIAAAPPDQGRVG